MSSFTATGQLARLALRLDRVRLPLWILAAVALTGSTASAFAGLYPTVESRLQFGASITGNPALVGLTGPVFDVTTIGGLTAWRLGAIAGVLVALMNILLVVRHTRAEEEAGRLELVGSAVVGRRAPLTAALLAAFAADLVVGALTAAVLTGMGEAAAGSVALGLSFAGVGALFAGVAAVAAQLTEGSRPANGIAAAALGTAYVLRAVGDSAGASGPSWLSWASPIGWSQQVRPFAGERWWVLGLLLAVTAGLVALSYALVARRDHGAGLVPARLGPPGAAPALSSPLALAWRLQRGLLAGWAFGFAAVGVALGSVAQGVGTLVDTSPQLRDILERMGGSGGLVDSYLASVLGIGGLAASAYAVAAALRLRTEETDLRAEPVLATPVSRIRWAVSHVVVTVGGTLAVLASMGLTAGLAHGLRTGDVAAQLPRILAGAFVQAPAALVLAGLAVALFGLAPRLTGVAWAAVAASFLMAQLGAILNLSRWLRDLSPFTHVPAVPSQPAAVTPLVVLALVAAGLTAAGLAGFRRRDVG
jgi:ABC-2 type transport system permease protein